MSNPRSARVLFVACSMLFSGALAHGAVQLLQFEPTPVSPSLPEFSYTGDPAGNFVTGPGVVGNGDGNQPVTAQTPGGLEVDTPLAVLGAPNSLVDGSGTHFYDVTLSLSSLNSRGATTTDLQGTGAYILVGSQEASEGLTPGSFAFYTTPATGTLQTPVLLLSGTLTGNSLTVPLGSSSAAVQSASVTYTGGLIYTALLAASGTITGGSDSISLVSMGGGAIGVTDTGTVVPGVFDTALISPFDANATGVFDTPGFILPEPASIAMAAGAGLMMLRRRRSQVS